MLNLIANRINKNFRYILSYLNLIARVENKIVLLFNIITLISVNIIKSINILLKNIINSITKVNYKLSKFIVMLVSYISSVNLKFFIMLDAYLSIISNVSSSILKNFICYINITMEISKLIRLYLYKMVNYGVNIIKHLYITITTKYLEFMISIYLFIPSLVEWVEYHLDSFFNKNIYFISNIYKDKLLNSNFHKILRFLFKGK